LPSPTNYGIVKSPNAPANNIKNPDLWNAPPDYTLPVSEQDFLALQHESGVNQLTWHLFSLCFHNFKTKEQEPSVAW
jgi:hypothetical protein